MQETFQAAILRLLERDRERRLTTAETLAAALTPSSAATPMPMRRCAEDRHAGRCLGASTNKAPSRGPLQSRWPRVRWRGLAGDAGEGLAVGGDLANVGCGTILAFAPSSLSAIAEPFRTGATVGQVVALAVKGAVPAIGFRRQPTSHGSARWATASEMRRAQLRAPLKTCGSRSTASFRSAQPNTALRRHPAQPDRGADQAYLNQLTPIPAAA